MTPIAPISPVFYNISKPVTKHKWGSKIGSASYFSKTLPTDLLKTMPWLKEKSIAEALAELNDLNFDKRDIIYLEKMGIQLPFKSGKDAVKLIQENNIRILFENTTENGIHAQYDFSKNLIIINNQYKNSKDFAVILAIAEAILHEAGHAKDNDGDSSVQEELNFLGMNAVAHRAFVTKYGDVFASSPDLIVRDGVRVYAKLFFENDPEKKNLIDRISLKYGDLPSGDRVHPPAKLALAIKNKAQS